MISSLFDVLFPLGLAFPLFFSREYAKRISDIFELFASNTLIDAKTLLKEENAMTLLSFLRSYGLINERQKPILADITEITSISGGRPEPFVAYGKPLDELEIINYHKHLACYRNSLSEAQKEWDDLSRSLKADPRGHMLAKCPEFYHFSWIPRSLLWLNSDGSHRTLKLRYLSKILKRDWVIHGTVTSLFINKSRTWDFLKYDCFLVPGNFWLEKEKLLAFIQEISTVPINEKEIFPSQGLLPWCELNTRLMVLPKTLNLGSLARHCGVFSFNDFICTLLSLESK